MSSSFIPWLISQSHLPRAPELWSWWMKSDSFPHLCLYGKLTSLLTISHASPGPEASLSGQDIVPGQASLCCHLASLKSRVTAVYRPHCLHFYPVLSQTVKNNLTKVLLQITDISRHYLNWSLKSHLVICCFLSLPLGFWRCFLGLYVRLNGNQFVLWSSIPWWEWGVWLVRGQRSGHTDVFRVESSLR